MIRELGLTMAQTGRLLGKTMRAMQRWSEGDGTVKDPAVVAIMRISRALQQEPHFLTKAEVLKLLHDAAGVPYAVPKTDTDELRDQQIKKLESIVKRLSEE